jgi:hypothetical protein
MMSHTWAIVLRGGMLSLRSYPPIYATMILSHRLLRYATPLLHTIAFGANAALVAIEPTPLYVTLLGVQALIVVGALSASLFPARPLLVARYYVLTTTSLAAGLWDWCRHGATPSWEAPAGTR